jgi:Zn-finger nucleic acid-binding protein
MEKACPSCTGRMIEGPNSHGAWGCTACGGVWAGKTVSHHVASVLDPGVRDLADVAQSYAEKQRGSRPGQVPRTCPECRSPLNERALGSVTVDVCTPHGTWFDRGELQRVADERQGKKPAPPKNEKKESGPPSHRGEELATDLAAGALGLLFAIITD